ncbi:MAG: threonine aldolase [Bacteroidetes bacterium 24-39-8]|nr:MAG: threonine aldolase [Sphingobacteriia bacterium 35-40-8]OYZ50310.1 MAG: threonine aldolase [Bacteroidetes bacterium 24-39-8]OZA66843.1 MAG: threonine aldolase [Sphingobacteriia bacterium 39-39-8]HQR92953.1 D-TA family PLP-dependent enzyme [Sediminibacterium sp.]HQS53923.1 D-TA family PLP-dependent enzyme [Sediminibacterium sp.]
MHWYEVTSPEAMDTPALLVYPDRVKENIRQAILMAGHSNNLRPHVKTHKIKEVSQLLLEQGIQKFKCATIAEAEMLGMIDAPDVLIAHQLTGPKAARLLALMEHYPQTHFATLVDNLHTATILSATFSAAGKSIDLYMDLNVGMNRSGIIPEKGLDLFKACLALPSIQLVGLHVYDGHLRDTDLDIRKQRSNEAFERATALAAEIYAATGKTMKMVAGGSPSFPTHTHRKGVEFSPGTFVFWDWGYKHIVPDEPFEYAALVATSIISIMEDNRLCLDLGHKAIAAENPLPRVHFLNAPEAVPVSQSEEHMVVQVADSSQYQVGELWYGVPVHICPTVALFAEAQVIQDHENIQQWQVIARNRKINI